MQIQMAGIDHTTAPVAVRERFALTTEGRERLLRGVYGELGVGCVLISTCNRTELYLAGEGDGAGALCRWAGVPEEEARPHLRTRRGRAAAAHLMMVACGLRSQLRGEDQILAQTKLAIAGAREAGTAGPVLETLFRCAVTAGKRARTCYPLRGGERSAAAGAVRLLERQMGGLQGQPVLVIGNGEMGRLAAELLAGAGAAVTVTIRSYKRGAVAVPAGCGAIPYADRYGVLPGFRAVVSATASPHFTLRRERLGQGEALPPYLVDLAVPRDIDPALDGFGGARVWDVDRLGDSPRLLEQREALLGIRQVQQEQLERFGHWLDYRARLQAVAAERS